MTRPDGLVDPDDRAEVMPVLAGALRALGPEGVVDLLARLPGVRREPGRPARLFSRAVPAVVWVGPENRLVLADSLVHEHVVGGVVLHREPLRPGDLPGVLAVLIADHARREAAQDDAAVALSAVRDVVG